MNQENHDLQGKVEIILKDKDGKTIQRRVVHNKIFNQGRQVVANLFALKEPPKFIRVGVRKENSASQDGNGNGNQEGEFNVLVGITEPSVDPGMDDKDDRFLVTFSSTFRDEIIGRLVEAGIVFSDEKSTVLDKDKDILYNVVKFGPIEKEENDEITFNWEITF